MTFTYGGDPSANSRDKVRFLLQDTVSPGNLSDEEIAFLLAEEATAELAALAGARTLHAKFAQQVTKAVGDLRLALSDRARAWAETIARLEETVARAGPVGIYAGGQSKDEARDDEQDTDLVQPRFEIAMHDFPGTPEGPHEELDDRL